MPIIKNDPFLNINFKLIWTQWFNCNDQLFYIHKLILYKSLSSLLFFLKITNCILHKWKDLSIYLMKTLQGNYKNLKIKTFINNFKLRKYSFLILKFSKLKRKSKLLMYRNNEHVNLQKSRSEPFNKKPNKLKSKLKCWKEKFSKRKNLNKEENKSYKYKKKILFI